MRLLVFSSTPWDTDNSFGNTYSNLFEGIDNIEFANIYCKEGCPKNNINSIYFYISEKSLLRNLVNSNISSGREVVKSTTPIVIDNIDNNINIINKLIEFARKNRWRIFFWIRRFIWFIGRWKSDELKKFISNFKPDIIFVPLYHSTYLNKIILFIKEYTGVKMVSYVSDDVYSLKRFSFSPFFWLDRIVTRRIIKKVVNQCEYLYVISDIQKKEYEKYFKKECKLLMKGADFLNKRPNLKVNKNDPLKFVYTGNIGAGRWKSLVRIGNALKEINNIRTNGQLYIYTMTPITRKIKKALNIRNTVFLMGGVSYEKIPQIQEDADILVHVESMDLKERLEVRHSFSTKLVDYFYRSRCIFAVGTPDVASIEYLIKNDAALVATNVVEIKNQLNRIINNPSIINEYAIKAWECGKKNHQIHEIQNRLYNDLKSLVKDRLDESITN